MPTDTPHCGDAVSLEIRDFLVTYYVQDYYQVWPHLTFVLLFVCLHPVQSPSLSALHSREPDSYGLCIPGLWFLGGVWSVGGTGSRSGGLAGAERWGDLGASSLFPQRFPIPPYFGPRGPGGGCSSVTALKPSSSAPVFAGRWAVLTWKNKTASYVTSKRWVCSGIAENCNLEQVTAKPQASPENKGEEHSFIEERWMSGGLL